MTAHPLAELADTLDGWHGLFASPDTDQPLLLAQRILRVLHPDVARVALALAEGLTVPDGWTVRMDEDGDLQVMSATELGWVSATELGWVFSKEGDWRPCLGDRHPTARAAVDAAVEALGGPR